MPTASPIPAKRIVVIGGHGNFGARIVRALALDPALHVVAIGRSPRTLSPDIAGLGVVSAVLDVTEAGFATALARLAPDIVVHCAGPFQGQDTRVALAALACGAHYLDLADGREFVERFAEQVHPAARDAQRLALSGCSTLPALSSAVVDHLRGDCAHLQSIDTVIAPAQRAPRGAATLAGVLSYVGTAFPVWEDGRWRTACGWTETRRVDLGPLGTRRSAVCNVPDLVLFPRRYPGVTHVSFRAALEIGVQHSVFAALAHLRRWGVPIRPEAMGAFLERAAGWFDVFGSDTGGMTVRVAGTGHDGQPVERCWRIVAPDRHGPEIPCMAAILLARRLARGALPSPGAHACMGFLTLDDFQPEFARWGMTTAIA